MKRTTLGVFVLLAAHAAGSIAKADRLKMARELAELAVRKFAGTAAKEGAEALTRRITMAVAKHGDDVFDAVRRVGPRALSLADDAGEHAPRVLRFVTRHGDEAASVLAHPRTMKLFANLGDDAGTALIRHAGVAEPLLEAYGKSAAKALTGLTPRNGRRLAILAEGEIGKTAQLIDVLARYGDKAGEFVWQNRGALAVGATLTAFLANPEPFLEAGTLAVSTAVDGGAKVADSVIQHTVKPAVVQLSTKAADSIPWAPLSVITVLTIGGVAALALRSSRIIPLPSEIHGR